MVKEYITGKTVVNTKVNICMIESMVMVFIRGQMVEDMKDIGRMVVNMEQAYT